MERRLTAFVLPVLLVAFAIVLFMRSDADEPEPKLDDPQHVAVPVQAPAGEPSPQPPGAASPSQNGQDRIIEKTFGIPGETGSFHIVFDRYGGSVQSIRLLDEPADPDARKLGTWPIEQSYELVRAFPMRDKGTQQIGKANSLELGQAGAQPGRRLQVPLGSPWAMRELEDGIEFSLTDPATQLTLRRTYRYEEGSRELILDVSLIGESGRGEEAEKALASGQNLALWLYGLSLVNPRYDHKLNVNPAVAIGRIVDENTGEAVVNSRPADGKEIEGKKPRIAYGRNSEFIDFAGTTNRFFGGFLRPENEAAKFALTAADVDALPKKVAVEGYAAYSVPVVNYRLSMRVPKAGERVDLGFRLYLGPKSSGTFSERPEYERYDVVMERDLQPMCPCSIPGAVFMASTLLWMLRLLEGIVGSWGVAIMLLTFIVRGSLVPLNFRMQKSMRAFGARAARLQPKLDEIKKRNANDPKKLQQEMMAFQKEHKLFPPLGGCLPLLVTIPVFLGLFSALRVAYELRCQPFIGWIDDLSQPDRLLYLGLPWQYVEYLNVLPILMVILWLVLQSGTPLPKDPQQRQVMKIMRFMPLLFGVMLYNYAAGLMVYMVTSSLFGIIEQRVTKKILGPPPETGAGVAAMPTF